jgi:hypothetical protein
MKNVLDYLDSQIVVRAFIFVDDWLLEELDRIVHVPR